MKVLALLMMDTTLGFFDFTTTSPVNQRDNGDAVVALMFVLSAECVSCWMLSLLMFLSPAHKRKPILAQLVTILFSIVYSVGLSYVTSTAKSQYLGNQLDVVSLEAAYFVDTGFKVADALGEALSYLAWLQIVLLMFASRLRNKISVVWITVITAALVVDIYYLIRLDLEEFLADKPPANMRWYLARALLKQILLVMFTASLGWYTIRKKPAVSYCRRLIPLSVFVWLTFAAHYVIYFLVMTKFRTNWLVRNWLATLPQCINIILITLVWEWVLSIQSLERRIEHSGMLGRRMSHEDRMSVTSRAQVDNLETQTGIWGRFLGNRKGIISKVSDSGGSLALSDNMGVAGGSKGVSWLEMHLCATRSSIHGVGSIGSDHGEGTSRSMNIPTSSSGEDGNRYSDDNDEDDYSGNGGGDAMGVLGEPVESNVLGHGIDNDNDNDENSFYGYTVEEDDDLDEEIIMTAGNVVSSYVRPT